MSQDTINNNASFIWSIAELLRGDFKQSEYGRIVLPFTILRQLDCLLEETKEAVLDEAAGLREEKRWPVHGASSDRTSIAGSIW